VTQAAANAYVSYNGNGATTSFSIPFTFDENDDVEVTLRTDSDDPTTETAQTSPAHYSISGSNVVMVTAPASGSRLHIRRVTDHDQELDLISNGQFSVTEMESALDKITRILQEYKRLAARAVKLPKSTTQAETDFPEAEAGAAIIWNADGDGLENGPSTTEISNAQGYAEDASDSADAADASADAAAASASTASSSATNASNSASAAATSATAAATSATAAATSATAAASSATSAATQATNAASSASAAATSATAAASSATAAASSASAAALSATDASASAFAALTYSGLAQGYANNANTSATNAATSESNAAASATAAAASAASTNVVSGSRGSPTAITAGGGITSHATALYQTQFIQGSGGAVTITANPAISAGTTVGQRLKLVGRSDTNTVTIPGATLGMELNGDCTLGASSVLTVFWDGTKWVEESRNDL
jgi:hypothetical protein